MNKPLIGITLDSEQAGGYSKYPWYAVRENYCDAVADAGGLPVPLPHRPEIGSDYLNFLDGLVVTGGAFDVDPLLFGAKKRHDTVVTKNLRTEFEFAITRGAIKQDTPILGICGGQQLLNVVLGGTLVQHIPDEIDHALAHEQPNPRNEPSHDITVKPNTLLSQITGTETMMVNSAHHQAVKSIGDSVIINATAPDGVVEGIELPGKRFCLGVQWHPEFLIGPGDKRIFDAFIDAAI